MSAPLECSLARLYTDEALLERFLAFPETILCNEDPETAAALRAIDRGDLRAAARSYRRERLSRSRG